MARSMYSAVIGWMVSSTRILTTLLAEAALLDSSASNIHEKNERVRDMAASFRRAREFYLETVCCAVISCFSASADEFAGSSARARSTSLAADCTCSFSDQVGPRRA